jgi:hypothetical protein
MSPLPRALLSLLVIAVAAGLLAVAARLQPAPPPPPGALVEPVVDIEPDQVTTIDVRSWQGRIAAARDGATWKVDSLDLRAGTGMSESERPSQQIVDSTVGDLVRALAATPEIDRFPQNDQPLAAFGLAEPQARIRFGLADGSERVIEIGGLTSTGAALYARVLPGDAIVSVGNLIFNDIQAALYRLRGLAKLDPASSGQQRSGAVTPERAPSGDGER